jgi:hypothetical protein
MEQLQQIVSEIVTRLAVGTERNAHNVLLHCLGGSGRTGTVVVSVLKQLGCARPIIEARKVKSVYLDEDIQTVLVHDFSMTIGSKFANKHPRFQIAIVAEHIRELCEDPSAVKYRLNRPPLGEDEMRALWKLWLLFDFTGSKAFSIGHNVDSKMRGPRTLTVREFAQILQGFLAGASKQRSRYPPSINVAGLEKMIRVIDRTGNGVDFKIFVDVMRICSGEEVDTAGNARWCPDSSAFTTIADIGDKIDKLR